MDDEARSETERIIAHTQAAIRRSEVHLARLQREQAEVQTFVDAARHDIAEWRWMLDRQSDVDRREP